MIVFGLVGGHLADPVDRRRLVQWSTAGQAVGAAALAGLLIGWVGVTACYLVDAGTFAIAWYAVRRLPSMPPDGGGAGRGLDARVGGLRMITQRPVLLSGAVTRARLSGLVQLGAAVVWGTMLAGFGLASPPWLALGALVVAVAADTVSVVSPGSDGAAGDPGQPGSSWFGSPIVSCERSSCRRPPPAL